MIARKNARPTAANARSGSAMLSPNYNGNRGFERHSFRALIGARAGRRNLLAINLQRVAVAEKVVKHSLDSKPGNPLSLFPLEKTDRFFPRITRAVSTWIIAGAVDWKIVFLVRFVSRYLRDPRRSGS